MCSTHHDVSTETMFWSFTPTGNDNIYSFAISPYFFLLTVFCFGISFNEKQYGLFFIA